MTWEVLVFGSLGSARPSPPVPRSGSFMLQEEGCSLTPCPCLAFKPLFKELALIGLLRLSSRYIRYFFKGNSVSLIWGPTMTSSLVPLLFCSLDLKPFMFIPHPNLTSTRPKSAWCLKPRQICICHQVLPERGWKSSERPELKFQLHS